MIYSNKNGNNDTTKGLKEKKTSFNVHAGRKLTIIV